MANTIRALYLYTTMHMLKFTCIFTFYFPRQLLHTLTMSLLDLLILHSNGKIVWQTEHIIQDYPYKIWSKIQLSISQAELFCFQGKNASQLNISDIQMLCKFVSLVCSSWLHYFDRYAIDILFMLLVANARDFLLWWRDSQQVENIRQIKTSIRFNKISR